LILSTDDGTRKGLGFIPGWLTSLVLVVAVVVLITGARPVRFRTFPSTVVLTIKLALGIALIVLAAVEWRRRNRAHRTPAWLARLEEMAIRLRRHSLCAGDALRSTSRRGRSTWPAGPTSSRPPTADAS
jgi:Sap, sulfolipid-1-addressing protein